MLMVDVLWHVEEALRANYHTLLLAFLRASGKSFVINVVQVLTIFCKRSVSLWPRHGSHEGEESIQHMLLVSENWC
jgi:hypothetical protein